MSQKKVLKRELIVNGNLFKVILVLSLPLVLKNVIQAFYQIIDTFFSDNIGENGLSAISFITPIMGFVLAIGAAISVAVTAMVARYLGKQSIKEARSTVINALLISGIVAITITALGFIFSYQIIRLLQAADSYARLASLYFRYSLLSLPLVFFGNIYFGYKSARGETLSLMIISVFGMTIKLTLSIIMINLNLGVLGLGLATLISHAVIMIIAAIDLFIVKSEYQINFNDLKLKKNILLPFTILMLPILVERTSLNFSHIIVNMFITPLDPAVLAAYGLTNKVNTLIFAVPTALGAALITIVGQNLTAGNLKKCSKAIYASIGLGIGISVVLLIILYSFQEPIIRMFTSDVQTISYTKDAMNVFSHTAIAWTFMQVAIGVFYAAGYSYYPIIISVSRLFLFRIPALWIMLTFTNLNEFSIWYGMLIANILAAILSIVLLLRIKWQQTPKYLENI